MVNHLLPVHKFPQKIKPLSLLHLNFKPLMGQKHSLNQPHRPMSQTQTPKLQTQKQSQPKMLETPLTPLHMSLTPANLEPAQTSTTEQILPLELITPPAPVPPPTDEQTITTTQDIWEEIAILQQNLDHISPLPQRLHHFQSEVQQVLTTFINLINTPLEEIALNQPKEALACLTAVQNLSPSPFNPIQLKQLARIINGWPTLLEMVQTCSKDIQSKKDFLTKAQTICSSLKLTRQTSSNISEQYKMLALEESRLEAELATGRQRRLLLQQQKDKTWPRSKDHALTN